MTERSRPVALVTGAGGNLGTAIALAFAASGHDLVLHHRSATVQRLVEQAALLGATARVVQADLTREVEIRRMFRSVSDLDLAVLVNCAGSYPPADFLASSADDWMASYSLHVVAALLCIQEAVPHMRAGSSIVNIGSIAAHRSPPDHGPYAAAKAALLSLTRTAAVALAGRGIRVNAVSPGLVRREGLEREWPAGLEAWSLRAPLGSPVPPDEVAAACVYLAGARAVTGQELVVDSGITAREDY